LVLSWNLKCTFLFLMSILIVDDDLYDTGSGWWPHAIHQCL
jgi:hypothetical protein